VITPWAFGHFLLRSQGVFALPVGKDSTQRSVQFSGAGSVDRDAFLGIMVDVARRDVALNRGGILLVHKIFKVPNNEFPDFLRR